KETARTLMRQMINSMSTKMEIGSPMASMYLLGNPDHYCSHKYVNFAWRSYVTFVKKYWYQTDEENEEEGITEDLLTVRNQDGSYVACSVVDDYRFRPRAYEHVNLYEWVQCSDKKARTPKERREFEDDLLLNNFEHHVTQPRKDYENEAMDIDSEPDNSDTDSDFDDFIVDDLGLDEKTSDIEEYDASDDESDWKSEDEDEIILNKVIPNFMGGAVPRADKGDREYYCMTIMTLFKPWRAPADLKDTQSTWDQIFHEHTFTDRQQQLIRNFNIRYECNDARDDHYSILRKKMAEGRKYTSNPILGECDRFLNDVVGEIGDEDMASDDEDISIGKKTDALRKSRDAIRDVLQAAKWLNVPRDGLIEIDTTRYIAPYKARRTWAEVLKSERKLHTANKLSNMPPSDKEKNRTHTANKVEVIPYDYLNPKSRLTKEANATLINDICRRPGLELNQEQERAFRIVAEHASAVQPTPLKMYLGGMGGSGKSAVFRAIMDFFIARKEEYRFMVVAPTGATAALLKGST
ncbi:hypothetical protein C8R43DRAFT_851200, partial [Mycena crocata]